MVTARHVAVTRDGLLLEGEPVLGDAASKVPCVPADPAGSVDSVGEQLVVPVVYHCDLGLKAISTGTVETNADRPEMVRLYTLLESEALSKDHPVHEYFEQREINLLREYAFAAKRDGVADPERTALQVLSAMEGLQLRWLNGSHDVDFVGEWKAIIDLLIP